MPQRPTVSKAIENSGSPERSVVSEYYSDINEISVGADISDFGKLISIAYRRHTQQKAPSVNIIPNVARYTSECPSTKGYASGSGG
jgi:hypothetical protein